MHWSYWNEPADREKSGFWHVGTRRAMYLGFFFPSFGSGLYNG
jgi:hypothetical protein